MTIISCRDSVGEKFWISCRVPGAKTIQERICRPTGRVPSDGKFIIQDYKQVKIVIISKEKVHVAGEDTILFPSSIILC
jgi:hypothetical protein